MEDFHKMLLMDRYGPDIEIPVRNGKHLEKAWG